MQVVSPICCGLDVHQATLTACVRRVTANGQTTTDLRQFGTTSPALRALSDWLVEQHCPVVAMESSGIYLTMGYASDHPWLRVSVRGNSAMQSIVEQCKQALEKHYGSRFAGLLLYGSMARNQTDASSDIDLLVLLRQPFNYFQELRTIVDLLYPLQMESERLISAKPAFVDEFEEGGLQLYRNAKREGVSV
jgi:predicted nucleotidyltransferase